MFVSYSFYTMGVLGQGTLMLGTPEKLTQNTFEIINWSSENLKSLAENWGTLCETILILRVYQ